MKLPNKAIKELQEILKKDYGQIVSKEDADELGHTLLRLTRVGLAALARASKSEKVSGPKDQS